jgi:hypothetical protein
MMEITNMRMGIRKIEMFSSTISWDSLEERMGELLNIYLKNLRLQYRLSTDSSKSLPFDLASQQQLDALITLLRPLIIPPRLANGKKSTRKMKSVSVNIFNKDDEPGSHTDEKVSDTLHFGLFSWLIILDRKTLERKLHARLLTQNRHNWTPPLRVSTIDESQHEKRYWSISRVLFMPSLINQWHASRNLFRTCVIHSPKVI